MVKLYNSRAYLSSSKDDAVIDPKSGEAMVFELTSEGVVCWTDRTKRMLDASDLPDGINLKAVWTFETSIPGEGVHRWSAGSFNVVLQSALQTIMDNPEIELKMFSL